MMLQENTKKIPEAKPQAAAISRKRPGKSRKGPRKGGKVPARGATKHQEIPHKGPKQIHYFPGRIPEGSRKANLIKNTLGDQWPTQGSRRGVITAPSRSTFFGQPGGAENNPGRKLQAGAISRKRPGKIPEGLLVGR